MSLANPRNSRPFVDVMKFVDDDSEGAVTSNVAGSAERVHRNVKGDDERLSVRAEAKYSGQWSQ